MKFKKLLYVGFFILLCTIVIAVDNKATATKFYWKPVLVYGAILGLYELFLIHADENFRGSHWLGHGLQSVGVMILAIFVVMNVEYFLQITGLAKSGLPSWLTNPHIVRGVVFLFLNIKIHATSAVFQTSGLTTKAPAEHWTHTTLVSALAVATIYVHPLIEPLFPAFLR
jgi:hypothetical protein